MSKFIAKNVICSFPHVFTANTKFGPDGKREITILLNKSDHADLIDSIKADIEEMKAKSSKPISDDKICLKDGDITGSRPEYAGHYTIKASSGKIVPVVDFKKDLLDQNTCDMQGGDIVNVSINLWLQDNSYGQRVNAQLNAVQYIKSGGENRFGDTNSGVEDFDMEQGLTDDADDF